MRSLALLVALGSLAACYGEQISGAQYSDGAFVDDTGDPGENSVVSEVRSLPFKHVQWEHKFSDRQISRLTMGGDHLYIETPENQVVAMNRFTGETSWIFKVELDTPLDWPPVVAHGVSEEIRQIEADLFLVNRQIDDKLKDVGVGKETQSLQKKRNEIRERLRVAAFGDNVYFISGQTVYCLDRQRGGLRWTHRMDFIPSARPFAIRNYIFVPGVDRARVWALDVEKKGSEVASYKASIVARENQVMNSPVFSDPSLYFVCHDGNFYCYKIADGSLTWTYQTERALKADPVVFVYRHEEESPMSTPVAPKARPRGATTRMLFAGGTDNAFYALDGDAGTLIWKYECGAEIKSPAVAKDHTVYVKTEEGALHAFEVMPMHRDPKGASLGNRRNGNLRWKLPLGERFLFKGKERVYVMGPNDEIWAVNEMTGETTGRYPTRLLQHILTNTVDDHIYVANAGGHIFCLKESRQSY